MHIPAATGRIRCATLGWASWQFSGKLTYSHDFTLRRGGLIRPMISVYYQTVSYLREFNLPIDKVPGYSKTNVNLEYVSPNGHWKIDAYADNLENNVVRNATFTAVGQMFSDYDPPRTYDVRISVKD